MIFNRVLVNKIEPKPFKYNSLLFTNEIPYRNSHISILLDKRCFVYYRFHKRIGKGNWNRYVERYTKPASIENTQPIHFNYKASYQSTKNSLSYLWELPKKIAASTTSNQLLDSWVYYRHKRKKLYHYVLALKRLNEIKQVDISDWRFKLILNKVVKRSRYFTDLPSVCYYLGNLKCVEAIEKVTYHLIERMDYYSPLQLARIASAFSSCKLYNKYLFSLLSVRFTSLIEIASNASIITVTRAFANCMVYNYKLFNSVSFEFQRRMARDTLHTRERALNLSHLPFSFKISKEPPSLSDLVNLGECFATAKYKDLNYFNCLTSLLIDHINDPESTDPFIITKAVSVYSTLKLNDIKLIHQVVNKAHTTPYNFPPAQLASLLKNVSHLIPRTLKIYETQFEDCLKHLEKYLQIMDNKSLADVAIFAHTVGLSDSELLESIKANLVKNSRHDRSEYDVPKLFEIMASKLKVDDESFDLFCYQMLRLIYKLEPCDFMRAARVLRKLKKHDMTDVKLLNLLGLRLDEVHDEFNPAQYNSVITDLTLSGNLQGNILRSMWSKNRYPKGFKPMLDEVHTS